MFSCSGIVCVNVGLCIYNNAYFALLLSSGAEKISTVSVTVEHAAMHALATYFCDSPSRFTYSLSFDVHEAFRSILLCVKTQRKTATKRLPVSGRRTHQEVIRNNLAVPTKSDSLTTEVQYTYRKPCLVKVQLVVDGGGVVAFPT